MTSRAGTFPDRNGWKFRLVVGLLASIVLTGLGWAYVALGTHGERLSGLESTVPTIKEDVQDMKAWLRRVEDKLDRVLER